VLEIETYQGPIRSLFPRTFSLAPLFEEALYPAPVKLKLREMAALLNETLGSSICSQILYLRQAPTMLALIKP
jgi:hypothetical protein